MILFLGYVYFRLAGEAYALVSIGLISFSAVAQFAPAILIGMFWKGGTRNGAFAVDSTRAISPMRDGFGRQRGGPETVDHEGRGETFDSSARPVDGHRRELG